MPMSRVALAIALIVLPVCAAADDEAARKGARIYENYCSTCHGDVKNMTVAIRAVNLNMGFCLSCHRAKSVSTDCVTCHF